jgi:ubiquinone/menaquinone biosynthesis C-methylase UbiE
MKEIDNVKYYNIDEIFEDVFHEKIKRDEIIEFFESGKLKGNLIDNEWYADENAINDCVKNVISYNVGVHKVDLSKVILKGRILDIGGGGQGIIGQFKGENVVAIDPNKDELEESPSKDDLKIVMDAKDLKFLDNTFDTATSFFTLMYIPNEDYLTIFQEIYRILKRNGEFVIWDAVIPNKGDDDRKLLFIRLEVIMGDKKDETGYGVLWNKELNVDYLSNMGRKTGFEILESKEEKNTFFLRLRKK